MPNASLSRRRVLEVLGLGGLGSALPAFGVPRFITDAGAAPNADHILVLIELAGGNDGLNTVVPFRDPAYRALRPEIGLDANAVVKIDDDTGLHPSLSALYPFWHDGEFRIVEGVGYPNPNRSHFRSIEIWNTGGGAEGVSATGWIADAFGDLGAPDETDADGIVLGGEMGPLAGAGRFAAIRDPDRFVAQSKRMEAAMEGHAVRPSSAGFDSPLDHVLSVYESAVSTAGRIRAKLARSEFESWDFPETDLGDQLRHTARLLDAGVTAPAFKVTLDGFDTHAEQAWQHEYLLEDLAQSVRAFAKHAKRMGMWDMVTIATYSEFGRRARENLSRGTDHGTAAPVLVLGGRVAGGLGGQRPSFDRLVDDDLVFTTDYRSVYSGLIADLWDQPGNAFTRAGHAPLAILKG